jgi:hypothetical protein
LGLSNGSVDDRSDGSGFQIHEDDSPRGASAPDPLANANNPQVPFSALSLRPTVEMPQNRIAAHHDARPGEQPARGFTSSAMAHHRQDFGDGLALLRVARGETGQSFREDRAIAGRRSATPFSDPETYDDRDALHWQIMEGPLIPAVPPLRDTPTRWTLRVRVALGLDKPMTFGPAD